MSTGFATLPRPEARPRARRASRRRAPAARGRTASHASAQRMPRPPAFVRTPTRRPRGSGWLESRPATSTSSSSVRARSTPAWWKSASTAASEPASAAVCELAAFAPAAVAPAFSARIGLRRATRRDESAELARVAERLEVEQHEVGLGIVLPPLEQVVRGDVRLVPDRDEGREAEAAPSSARAARARGRPLCEEKPIAPGGSARGAKVAFSFGFDDGDAEAVRPEQPRAVRANEREQLAPAARALGAGLGEAGRDHAERAHALAQRLVGRLEHAAAGQADDREVDRVGDLGDRVVAAHAGDRLAAAVDRVGGAGEVGLEHVAEELAADRAAPARGADHGHGRAARRTGAARRPRRRGRAPRRAPGSSRSARSGS